MSETLTGLRDAQLEIDALRDTRTMHYEEAPDGGRCPCCDQDERIEDARDALATRLRAIPDEAPVAEGVWQRRAEWLAAQLAANNTEEDELTASEWLRSATIEVPDEAPAAEVSGEPTLAEWIGDLDGIGPQTPPLCRDLREGGLDE